MKPRVLITGGSGLLALNWAVAVRETHDVTLGLHERNVSMERIQTRRIYLESVDSLVRALVAEKPDIIIHTAGLTSVEKCEAEPALAQHINVDLAGNVALACAKLNLPLVHISTDHLFSGEADLVDETCPVQPKNHYGRSKAEAEIRVLEAHPSALVARTNFYCWGPSYRRSFSDIIIEALRSGKELTLFPDVYYTPILVEAAAQAVHELLEQKASGIVHVVGDDRISKHDFGHRIAQEFGLDAGLIKTGYFANQTSLVQRPHDMSLSNKKVCSLLGRNLGGVAEHVERLHQQEICGIAQEIHKS
jgi:dTDP-4-dehydrorhamnose reductase